MQNVTITSNRIARCPNCGKMQPSPDNRWCYGSPLRKCPHCGTEYFDDRYREIAIEGYIPNALSPKRSLSIAAIGLAFVLFAIFMRWYQGYYSTRAIVIAIGGAAVIVCGIVDFLNIITGTKQKTFERFKADSEERMKDPDYVQRLTDAGMGVPEKYRNRV